MAERISPSRTATPRLGAGATGAPYRCIGRATSSRLASLLPIIPTSRGFKPPPAARLCRAIDADRSFRLKVHRVAKRPKLAEATRRRQGKTNREARAKLRQALFY